MKPAFPDLSTSYLGLHLDSPLVPSASPLSQSLEGLIEMQRCGAGAVVLHSLFQQPSERLDKEARRYADEISRAKQHLKIPVVGSLNASTLEDWVRLSQVIQEAGADALELTIHHLSLNPDMPSADIENAYLDITRAVTSNLRIPVAVKLPPFFTNLARMTRALSQAGAKGVVLFNRLYQPEVDFETMVTERAVDLSHPAEGRLSRHAIALLYRQAPLDFAASTGLSTGSEVLRAVLAGASVAQVCSILLRCGIGWLLTLQEELRECMKEHRIPSLLEARGRFSHPASTLPGEVEREEYAAALRGYSYIDVPVWHDEVPLKMAYHHAP